MIKFVFTLLLCFIFHSQVSAQVLQLYGLTPGGGSRGQGNIFKINSDGTGYEEKFAFDSLTGFEAWGTLIQASDGLLYGVTERGGPNNLGVLFSFNPLTNVYRHVQDFDSTTGCLGAAELFEMNDGKLYGMLPVCGNENSGVIFSYDPLTDMYSKLFDFDSVTTGRYFTAFIKGNNGKLIGATGNRQCSAGLIFEFDILNSNFNVLTDFCSTSGYPVGNVIQDSHGNIYSFTGMGGTATWGSLYVYPPNGNLTEIMIMASTNFGVRPVSAPLLINNEIYGMTNLNGSSGGSIFKFNKVTYADSLLYTFNGISGKWPNGSLRLLSDGRIYGATWVGGINNRGVLFAFDINTNTYTKLHDFNGADGANPTGNLIEVDTSLFYLSLENLKDPFDLKIFPNPAMEVLNIKIKMEIKNLEVLISSIDGKSVFKGVFSGTHLSVFTGEFEHGVYFLTLRSPETSVTKKIIVYHQ